MIPIPNFSLGKWKKSRLTFPFIFMLKVSLRVDRTAENGRDGGVRSF